MEVGSSPRNVTTKRRVKYRKSSWAVQEFEVWSGEMVCRGAVLRTQGGVLLWLGGREARLGHVALGVPRAGGALATPLLGAADDAVGHARRLAAALACPAHVCCGQDFDRFAAPLVARGVAAALRAQPDPV
ncbi:uncharacterized protein LOC120626104 [Pararge aegeria]|uniref:Proteasome assembly chaperone n=1 Tax=Pararge aegeria TaxID=116150 RepID=S4PTI7_9NEOP|nr:uncharacterized protein LOC120626104 [Pararge aegeria]